jgi:tRNA pseudouridine38-40 synthase
MKNIYLWWARYLLFSLCTIDGHQAFVPSFASFADGRRTIFNKTKARKRAIETIFLSPDAFCATRSDDTATASTLSPNESDPTKADDEDAEEQLSKLPLTNAVLRISYDGSRFTGWSAANSNNDQSLTKRRKRNRRRGGVEEFHEAKLPAGFVRSVEGILKNNLAKLYGDVDPNTRIIVEGCSRTDKGVHATCMIAHVYCLKNGFSTRASTAESNNVADNENEDNNKESLATHHTVIPGKRIPHPISPTDDSCFEALPMNSNLSRMAFSFNRMRPPDVQITGIAPAPRLKDGEIFHASLSSKCKRYEYRISTGNLWDPTLRKVVWHVGSSYLDLEKVQRACELMRGTHDFSAFQGAARGSEDKRKRIEQQQNHDGILSSPSSSLATGTICTLFDLRVDIQHPSNVHEDYYYPGVDPSVTNFNIVVKGDRFLYKMVRFIVGSLVAVGYGKLDLEDIERAIATGSWDIPDDPSGRRKQFECAPAHGLTLTHVDYGDSISFDWQPLRDPTKDKR